MSWSIAYPSAEAFRRDERSNAPTAVIPEAEEQIKAARAAAMGLLDSQATGKRDVAITLSGHANEGHEPKAGWSGDSITVSIYQKS